MGMYDRDWYRESYKEKEEKYGGDFSQNTTKSYRITSYPIALIFEKFLIFNIKQ